MAGKKSRRKTKHALKTENKYPYKNINSRNMSTIFLIRNPN